MSSSLDSGFDEIEMSETLISLVEKRPALFDKTNENYANRHYISRTWREIGERLGVSGDKARKKWTKLRDYFQKNHRRVSEALKRGEPPRKIKKWYLYENMVFLSPYLSDRQSFINDNNSNIFFSEESNGSHHSQNTEEIAVPFESPELSSLLNSTTTATATKVEDLPSSFYSSQQGDSMETVQKTSPHRKMAKFHHKERLGVDFTSPSNFDPELMNASAMQERGEPSSCFKTFNTNDDDDDDEYYCRSLVPKMRLLDPIAKMECQVEIHQVLIKYLKQIQRPDQS